MIGDNHLGDWGKQFGMDIAAIGSWGKPDGEGEAALEELDAQYTRYARGEGASPTLDDEARALVAAAGAGRPARARALAVDAST